MAVTYIQGPSKPEPFPAGDVVDSEVVQSEVDVVQGDQNSSEMVVEDTSHEDSAKSLDAGGCSLSPRTSSSGPFSTLVLALLLILRRRLA